MSHDRSRSRKSDHHRAEPDADRPRQDLLPRAAGRASPRSRASTSTSSRVSSLPCSVRPGCGKTTTLRMIAGLETVTSGSIRIGDREISQLPAAKRGIGVGFESYALYPPMSVRDNLLLRAQGPQGQGCRADGGLDQQPARDGRPARPAARGAVQRSEAAGRAGPCAGAQPAGAAARRAAEPPGRVGSAAGASRTEGAAARIRLHHDRRHPRPGRGAVAGRPARGDGRRRRAAVRHPRRGVRRSGQPVRRPVRR